MLEPPGGLAPDVDAIWNLYIVLWLYHFLVHVAATGFTKLFQFLQLTTKSEYLVR